MTINILTIFPEFFTTPLQESILKRAHAKGLVEFQLVNIRDFAQDKHKMTDDRPFGGGPGMVMKVEPIALALESLGIEKGQHESRIILTSAKGSLFNQQTARSFSQLKTLTIICGHYEGVDERVAQHLIDEELRIGDYVLTGGEPAAVVMTDAVTRLIPGVLGNDESNVNESHSTPGQLGHPQYTRPEEFRGWEVPEILLGGHHAEIEKWRQDQAKSL
jgi:tRNA (guanine37-N1)-methyltransferase